MQTEEDRIEGGIASAVAKLGLEDEPEVDSLDQEIADEGEGSSTVESSDSDDGAAEGETTADVPTEYWGVDLSDIPVERRAEIIAHFEQQDSTIHKLQDKLSAPPEETPPVEETEEEEISDEDLLKAAGYDPEDEFQARQVLPLLRQQLALEDTVETLQRSVQGREVETQWNGALDGLEAQYGKLPGSREAILREAVAQGYRTPYEAYFRLAAPARKEVEDAAAKARRELAKKTEGKAPKPRTGSGDIETPAVSKEMSLRDAVAAAAKNASKKTGFSWREAAKTKFRGVPEAE
jgi:hypothetical protein